MSLLLRLGCSETVIKEVQTAVESHNKPKSKVVPAAEKQVFILKGNMDRAERHLEHLRSVSEQKQREYDDAVQRAEEQASVYDDVKREYWRVRKSLQKKPESETTSEEGEKCEGPTIVSCDEEEPEQDITEMAIPSGSVDDTHMNEAYPEEMLQDIRSRKRSVFQTKKKGAIKVKVVPKYKELDDLQTEEQAREAVAGWSDESVQLMRSLCEARIYSVATGLMKPTSSQPSG